jgi:hypothetical protein
VRVLPAHSRLVTSLLRKHLSAHRRFMGQDSACGLAVH